MFNDLLNLMALAPQLLESLQKMSDEEIKAFVDQLSLLEEEKVVALKVIKGFSRGAVLSNEDRLKAIELLTKLADKNNLNLDELIKK